MIPMKTETMSMWYFYLYKWDSSNTSATKCHMRSNRPAALNDVQNTTRQQIQIYCTNCPNKHRQRLHLPTLLPSIHQRLHLPRISHFQHHGNVFTYTQYPILNTNVFTYPQYPLPNTMATCKRAHQNALTHTHDDRWTSHCDVYTTLSRVYLTVTCTPQCDVYARLLHVYLTVTCTTHFYVYTSLSGVHQNATCTPHCDMYATLAYTPHCRVHPTVTCTPHCDVYTTPVSYTHLTLPTNIAV